MQKKIKMLSRLNHTNYLQIQFAASAYLKKDLLINVTLPVDLALLHEPRWSQLTRKKDGSYQQVKGWEKSKYYCPLSFCLLGVFLQWLYLHHESFHRWSYPLWLYSAELCDTPKITITFRFWKKCTHSCKCLLPFCIVFWFYTLGS